MGGDKMEVRLSDLEIMGSSGLGAACAVFFTNPLEVAKTRLQQQNELVRASSKVYKNGLDVLIKTWHNEGFRGVQRGLELAVVRDGSKCFFRLGLYEPVLRRLHTGPSMAPFHVQLFAGGVSGLVASVLCNPLDLVKVRVQTSGSLASSGVHHNIAKLSTWGVFRKVYVEEGILGFWKGVVVNILRGISFTSILMSVNSRVKHGLTNTLGMKDGFLRDATGSFIGSFIGIIFMNPVDVVRTRIYNQPVHDKLYHGMIDATSKIIRTEGVFAFWKGAFAHYCRVGPHTVLSFVFIGEIQRTLLQHHRNNQQTNKI